jgi:hypothetical protein
MQKYEIGGKIYTTQTTVSVTDEFTLGSPVRVLIKDYSNKHTAHTGVIIAIDQFKNRPAVTICYLEASYSNPDLKFKTITGDEKEECEITNLGDVDERLTVGTILDVFEGKVKAKKNELDAMLVQQQNLTVALERICKK